MSIFENEEHRLLEAERQEAEELASIERQKEIDEINQSKLELINTLIDETNIVMKEEANESIKCGQVLLEALILLRDKIMVADPKIGQSNNEVKLPEGYYLGQTVYMVPTQYNCLTKIKSYTILSFGLAQIGPRADLSVIQKERGVEPLYCASFDMFNKSIFNTLDKAKSFMEGC